MTGGGRIGLVPVGKIIDRDLIDHLRTILPQAFGGKVEVVKRLRFPQYAFDERRRQYHSTLILAWLRQAGEGIYERILGLVDVDLFTPSLNFVFGEADILHGVSVISLYRLRPENYGQAEDPKTLRERALKEAIHELGHTYGLMHCLQYRCVMHFSNQLSDTDRKGHLFCRHCRDSLVAVQSKPPLQGERR